LCLIDAKFILTQQTSNSLSWLANLSIPPRAEEGLTHKSLRKVSESPNWDWERWRYGIQSNEKVGFNLVNFIWSDQWGGRKCLRVYAKRVMGISAAIKGGEKENEGSWIRGEGLQFAQSRSLCLKPFDWLYGLFLTMHRPRSSLLSVSNDPSSGSRIPNSQTYIASSRYRSQNQLCRDDPKAPSRWCQRRYVQNSAVCEFARSSENSKTELS